MVLMRDIPGKKVGEMGATGFERDDFRPLDLMMMNYRVEDRYFSKFIGLDDSVSTSA